MQVLSKTEQPNSRILDGLFESLHSGSLLFDIDSVSEQSFVCELSLLSIKPSSSQRSIGEER